MSTTFNWGGFDPDKITDDRQPIPAGEYQAMVTEASEDPTRAGNGLILKLTWTIAAGAQKGRKVFQRITLANPNEQAVTIGHAELKRVCAAVGIARPKRGAVEFLNKRALITVGHRDYNGKVYDEVKSIKAPVAPASAPAPATVESAAPAADEDAPWA